MTQLLTFNNYRCHPETECNSIFRISRCWIEFSMTDVPHPTSFLPSKGLRPLRTVRASRGCRRAVADNADKKGAREDAPINKVLIRPTRAPKIVPLESDFQHPKLENALCKPTVNDNKKLVKPHHLAREFTRKYREIVTRKRVLCKLYELYKLTTLPV